MSISKIVIGITTYGPIPRAERLIQSIFSNLEPQHNPRIVCGDDTPVTQIRERRKFCEKWNVTLLEGGQITGIPATWNKLARFDQEADLIIIFSDGIRVIMPGWINRLVYFFDNNENVGTVGLPLLHRSDDGKEDGYKDNDQRWHNPVGLVGAAVGCAFAARPKDLLSIENPDGTRGFWEDLISFHEEIHMGFKLAEKGLLSYMLPWPPVSYRGGMAFSTHDELVWRQQISNYLPMDQFLKYVRQTRWYVPSYEEKYANGIVDKMSYSRIMLAKYWGLLEEIEAGNRIQEIKGEQVDILNEPQKFVHPLVVDKWPSRQIKWLNRDGKEEEALI